MLVFQIVVFFFVYIEYTYPRSKSLCNFKNNTNHFKDTLVVWKNKNNPATFMINILLCSRIKNLKNRFLLIVRVEMHLEQQRLIKIFLASLDMNPSALHGTGLGVHDLLRGKKQTKLKVLHFALQI